MLLLKTASSTVPATLKMCSAQGKTDPTGTGSRDVSHARRTKITGDKEIEVMSSRKTNKTTFKFMF